MLEKLRRNYVEFQLAVDVQGRLGPLIGLIGYPSFYLIWTFILPQPYNNAWLSIVGLSNSAILYWSDSWPPRLKHALYPIRYASTIYNLPFFFTYMLVMNGSNPTWQLSCMTGFIYLMLLTDRLNAIVMTTIGVSSAIFLHALNANAPALDNNFMVTFIAISFVMLGYGLLARKEAIMHAQKLRGAALMASSIAHEVRTPLAGIRLDTEQCLRLLPPLMESHDWAVANGWDNQRRGGVNIGQLTTALRRVLQHARSADTVVDMVLVSAGSGKAIATTRTAIADTVMTAIAEYPMREDQRARLEIRITSDFSVLGSDVLIRHIIYNLLKNALRSLDQRGAGNVQVEVSREATKGWIRVRDTGTGILDRDQPFIFEPFYTTQTSGQGAGIGLAFCKVVIEQMGGTLKFKSVFGEGTTFEIGLPTYSAPTDFSEV